MQSAVVVRGSFRLAYEPDPHGGPEQARVRWSSFSAFYVVVFVLVSLGFVGFAGLVLSLLEQLFTGTYETLLTLLCVAPPFVIMALFEWLALGKLFNRCSVVLRLAPELHAGDGYRGAAIAALRGDRVEMAVKKGPFVLPRGSWTRVGVRRVERRVLRGVRGATTYAVYALCIDGSELIVESFDEAERADDLVAVLEAELGRLVSGRATAALQRQRLFD